MSFLGGRKWTQVKAGNKRKFEEEQKRTRNVKLNEQQLYKTIGVLSYDVYSICRIKICNNNTKDNKANCFIFFHFPGNGKKQ